MLMGISATMEISIAKTSAEIYMKHKRAHICEGKQWMMSLFDTIEMVARGHFLLQPIAIIYRNHTGAVGKAPLNNQRATRACN
jgi:hypothetical protein